jgi:hypothetical protein
LRTTSDTLIAAGIGARLLKASAISCCSAITTRRTKFALFCKPWNLPASPLLRAELVEACLLLVTKSVIEAFKCRLHGVY